MVVLATLLLLVGLGALIGVPLVLVLRPVLRRCKKEAEEERESEENRAQAIEELRNEGITIEADDVEVRERR